MLDNILMEICQEMSTILTTEQSEKLKSVLFVCFHGKTVVEEKNEIIASDEVEDMKLIKLFRASKIVAGRSEKTLEQYVRELRFCRHIIGKNFKDITSMDLRWYFGISKEKRGNKMSTIQNKLHYLNSFYSFLLNEGLISSNPVSKIEPPKIEKTIKKPFSAEDMELIRKWCKHPRDRALIEFLSATGLRVSEVSSLNIGDIDLEKKEFNVVGKGNKERSVYFSPISCFYLRDYFKWRMQVEGLSLEELKSRPLFVCTKKPFKRILKPGIEFLCRKIGKDCGITNVHPHRFRRTFATNMANKGMKLEELMRLMGHNKMDTTLIYCNVNQDNIKYSYNKFIA